jgi:ribosomal protein S12 methylthiotransferase accessory factor
MLDHATFYFAPARAKEFERIRSENERVELAELTSRTIERSLPVCATALAEAGIRVALVDATSSDVATSPFRVVRAVSPDLEAISYGHGLARARTRRGLSQTPPVSDPPLHPLW